MSTAVVQSFSNKTGLPVADVEKYWDKAKELVIQTYGRSSNDGDIFYRLVTGVLKRMIANGSSDTPMCRFSSATTECTVTKRVCPLFEATSMLDYNFQKCTVYRKRMDEWDRNKLTKRTISKILGMIALYKLEGQDIDIKYDHLYENIRISHNNQVLGYVGESITNDEFEKMIDGIKLKDHPLSKRSLEPAPKLICQESVGRYMHIRYNGVDRIYQLKENTPYEFMETYNELYDSGDYDMCWNMIHDFLAPVSNHMYAVHKFLDKNSTEDGKVYTPAGSMSYLMRVAESKKIDKVEINYDLNKSFCEVALFEHGSKVVTARGLNITEANHSGQVLMLDLLRSLGRPTPKTIKVPSMKGTLTF